MPTMLAQRNTGGGGAYSTPKTKYKLLSASPGSFAAADSDEEPLLEIEDATDDDSCLRKSNSNTTTTSNSTTTMLNINIPVRLLVLVALCLENSMSSVMRRYSQGIRREQYSKYELLFVAECIKLIFSAIMVKNARQEKNSSSNESTNKSSLSLEREESDADDNSKQAMNLGRHFWYLMMTSRKMIVLAVIYGGMNILSLVALQRIGAGLFTIMAQIKILTTAVFSTIILKRQYSWPQWRALLGLVAGVVLFSHPIWSNSTIPAATATGDATTTTTDASSMLAMPSTVVLMGVFAVLIEVTLSGFASIYFEKVIKTDPLQLTIWERNVQLAAGSLAVYMTFILHEGGGANGYFAGWSLTACIVAGLLATGGLLVALSIKHGDSVLKTLATTGAIILSSVMDHFFLGGPLTPIMIIAAVQVIIAICNYTFDATPPPVDDNNKPLLPPSASDADSDTSRTSRTTESDEEQQTGGLALKTPESIKR